MNGLNIVLLIFIPIISALTVYLFRSRIYTKLSIIFNIFEIGFIIFLIKNIIEFGEMSYIIGGWDENIGISMILRPGSSVLLLVVAFIWLIVTFYSYNRWKNDYKFYFFLNFLRGAFYGLIVSNDIFNIFIFIEIISIISSIMIIYKKDGFSIRAGIYYLLFNSIGMIFYLLALIIIYTSIGTLALPGLVNLEMNFLNKIAIGLIFVSLGVKSAFFPVYNWLPRAHSAAPSSISALLSGVLVKTGFIVLIKIMNYVNLNFYFEFFTFLGIFTAISGLVFAISQNDVKLVLAFSTISQSGLILVGIVGTGILHVGGILHLINHVFFKSLLFLTIGIIIEKYNIRKVDKLQGVFKQLPVVSAMLIIGMISISGMPYTNGYVSKFLIKTYYKDNMLMMYLFHFINFGTAIYYVKMASILFGNTHNKEIKSSFRHNLPVLILGIITISLGMIEMHYLKEISGIKVYVKLNDIITYILYVGFGVLFYKQFLVKELNIFRKIRNYKLNFRDANTLLLVFVIITIMIAF